MELITTKTALASDMGVSNNLFGGVMLSWLDLAGAAYAAQLTDSPRLVTVKFEEVIFNMPVKVGNLIKIYGEVVKFGETSITIHLEARKHNVENGDQFCVCDTKVVFVKINEEGTPCKISDRVKVRYRLRMEGYNRAILTPEELESEAQKESLTSIDIFDKASIDCDDIVGVYEEKGDDACIKYMMELVSGINKTESGVYLKHLQSIMSMRAMKFPKNQSIYMKIRAFIKEMLL